MSRPSADVVAALLPRKPPREHVQAVVRCGDCRRPLVHVLRTTLEDAPWLVVVHWHSPPTKTHLARKAEGSWDGRSAITTELLADDAPDAPGGLRPGYGDSRAAVWWDQVDTPEGASVLELAGCRCSASGHALYEREDGQLRRLLQEAVQSPSRLSLLRTRR